VKAKLKRASPPSAGVTGGVALGVEIDGPESAGGRIKVFPGSEGQTEAHFTGIRRGDALPA
jgi:hypothetical protein